MRTLRSITVSGRLNSPTMHSGIAPPQGLALSSLRSNMTVLMPFSCAKISVAQASDGTPPMTETLHLMQRHDTATKQQEPLLLTCPQRQMD
jgi:hypothetical protein